MGGQRPESAGEGRPPIDKQSQYSIINNQHSISKWGKAGEARGMIWDGWSANNHQRSTHNQQLKTQYSIINSQYSSEQPAAWGHAADNED
jgi:hypothetical protein